MLSFELKCIYKVIGNPSIEYYFGEWTLRSLNLVEERFNVMKKEAAKMLQIEEHKIRYWDSIDHKTNKIRFHGLSTRNPKALSTLPNNSAIRFP